MTGALLALFLLATPAVFATRPSVLILDTADDTRGLCVAISSAQCVTAYHVVEGHGAEFRLTDQHHKQYTGRLGWTDKRKDLAIVLAVLEDGNSFSPVTFGTRLPVETEDVWTWVIYEDRTIHLFEGKWAGARRIDDETYHVIDGYTEGGTSGGVTVNASGEAIGVQLARYNPIAKGRYDEAATQRPLALVRPVLGGVGKR